MTTSDEDKVNINNKKHNAFCQIHHLHEINSPNRLNESFPGACICPCRSIRAVREQAIIHKSHKLTEKPHKRPLGHHNRDKLVLTYCLRIVSESSSLIYSQTKQTFTLSFQCQVVLMCHKTNMRALF